jgi:CubicO group peptidase (beta-lactamase class C family)
MNGHAPVSWLRLIVWWMALTSGAAAQAVDAASIDRVMEEALRSWGAPGAALAIVRDDQVVYLKGFGVKDLSARAPVTPDTLFAIGSASKAFTTAAMAMLVDEGKMGWDDPVRRSLPSFRLSDPLASEMVTLRDLVTHRTGLTRHDLLWYGSPWSRDEIIRRIGSIPPTYPFRTAFQYQNIMFLTAGVAVGNATGSTWEEFTRRRIFDPLGMKTANFSTKDAEKSSDLAMPHVKGPNNSVIAIPWRNIDNVGPAGSINASARELTAWLRLQVNGGVFEGKRLISPAAMREMHTPQMVVRLEGRWKLFFPESETTQLSYGLGWFISSYRGHRLVMHGGSIDGFRAQIILVPQSGLALAVLTNLGNTQLPEAAAYNVVDHLLGLESRDWNAFLRAGALAQEAEATKVLQNRLAGRRRETKPSREIAAYAGDYEDPGYGRVTISVDGDSLQLRWSSFNSKLAHFHYDTFTVVPERSPLAHEAVVFMLGADGEVAQLNLLGANFRRRKAAPGAQSAGH